MVSGQRDHVSRICWSFLDLVSDWVDEGSPMDAVYLDFQKAFDKVSHSKLLSKMDRYGIDKGVVRWVRSWLSGRRQRVVIDGVIIIIIIFV